MFVLAKLSTFINQNSLAGQLLGLGLVGTVITVIYLFLISMLKVEEKDIFLDMIKKRWHRGR